MSFTTQKKLTLALTVSLIASAATTVHPASDASGKKWGVVWSAGALGSFCLSSIFALSAYSSKKTWVRLDNNDYIPPNISSPFYFFSIFLGGTALENAALGLLCSYKAYKNFSGTNDSLKNEVSKKKEGGETKQTLSDIKK